MSNKTKYLISAAALVVVMGSLPLISGIIMHRSIDRSVTNWNRANTKQKIKLLAFHRGWLSSEVKLQAVTPRQAAQAMDFKISHGPVYTVDHSVKFGLGKISSYPQSGQANNLNLHGSVSFSGAINIKGQVNANSSLQDLSALGDKNSQAQADPIKFNVIVNNKATHIHADISGSNFQYVDNASANPLKVGLGKIALHLDAYLRPKGNWQVDLSFSLRNLKFSQGNIFSSSIDKLQFDNFLLKQKYGKTKVLNLFAMTAVTGDYHDLLATVLRSGISNKTHVKLQGFKVKTAFGSLTLNDDLNWKTLGSSHSLADILSKAQNNLKVSIPSIIYKNDEMGAKVNLNALKLNMITGVNRNSVNLNINKLAAKGFGQSLLLNKLSYRQHLYVEDGIASLVDNIIADKICQNKQCINKFNTVLHVDNLKLPTMAQINSLQSLMQGMSFSPSELPLELGYGDGPKLVGKVRAILKDVISNKTAIDLKNFSMQTSKGKVQLSTKLSWPKFSLGDDLLEEMNITVKAQVPDFYVKTLFHLHPISFKGYKYFYDKYLQKISRPMLYHMLVYHWMQIGLIRHVGDSYQVQFSKIGQNYQVNGKALSPMENAYALLILKKIPQSTKQILSLAYKGNVDAEMLMSQLYHFGVGVNKDDHKAFSLMQKAVHKADDNTSAEIFLAGYYYEGIGVDRSYDQAMSLLQNAAQSDRVDAQAALGNLYITGLPALDVKPDYLNGISWLQKAALQNLAYAAYQLGNIYSEGKGVPQNNLLAFQYYGQAGRLGLSILTKYKLEALFAKFTAPQYYNFSQQYYLGRGLDRNYQQAYVFATLAFDKGITKSAIFRNKAKIKLKYAEQKQAFAKLAEIYKQQDNDGQAYFYTALASGNDYDDSQENLEGLTDNLDSETLQAVQTKLGDAYASQENLIVKRNLDLAASWYKAAAEGGNGDAQYKLSQVYGLDSDTEDKSQHWLLTAAKSGQPAAVMDLYWDVVNGEMKSSDIPNFDQSFDLAVQAYLKLAGQGDADAAKQLADIYKTGEKSEYSDFTLSEQWLLKARTLYIKQVLKQGDPDIFTQVSNMYLNQSSSDQGDSANADVLKAYEYGYLADAYTPKNNDIVFEEGKIFSDNFSGLTDNMTAKQLAQGQIWIAQQYETGSNVLPKDIEQAYVFYSLSTANQNQAAALRQATIASSLNDSQLKAAHELIGDIALHSSQILGSGSSSANNMIAVDNYKQAVKLGSKKAAMKVATLYDQLNDNDLAFSWYQKAAKSGDVDAMYKLADRYSTKADDQKSYAQLAIFWYTKGACKGDAYAATSLSNLYSYGFHNVAKNPEKRYLYYLLYAKLAPDDSSPEDEKQLEKGLTAKQIAMAHQQLPLICKGTA